MSILPNSEPEAGKDPARNDASYAELNGSDYLLLGESERELRALTFVLVLRLSAIRAQRGRDFIRALPFGDVLDRLDSAYAMGRYRAARAPQRYEP